MNLRSFFALAALALVSTTASAETVCEKCDYPFPYVGYLGSYWPGDRGTFQHFNIVEHIRQYFEQINAPYDGTFVGFDNYWVFDVNDNATLNATATQRNLTDFGVELYTDAGSVCYAVVCPTLALGTRIAVVHSPVRRWTIEVNLTPGRYILRMPGQTTTAGSYTGRVSFTTP